MYERELKLYIDTETLQFYAADLALMAAAVPTISAGELVRYAIQLCKGAPEFSGGVLSNPDSRFSGSLASCEVVIDNNFNWYDRAATLSAISAGSAISKLKLKTIDTFSGRQIGAIRIGASDVVRYCAAETLADGIEFTLADGSFVPAPYTPGANYTAGAIVRVIEQPIIVSAQNDASGRDSGLFAGVLDAANPVYLDLVENSSELSGTMLEVNLYLDGRSVFRARTAIDCTGSLVNGETQAWLRSGVWTEADSRYILRADWIAADEYRFSEDGSNWHTAQTDNDAYMQARRNGGAWGATIMLRRGQQGDAFTYADFTPEQLAALKGEKGDKGDAFVYADFTPEQLAGLAGADGNFENGVPDFTFTPGGTLTKTAVELGVTGEPPVAVYDASGYDVTADARVSVKWSAGTLTVITPADATGTWRIKFGGGSVNIRERVAAWPRAVFAGRRCYLIDATSSELEIDDMLRNVATVSFFIRSASAVTGNIVLRADVDAVEVKTFVIPVTAADVMQKMVFDSAITGELKFVALTSDERWTLRDTDVVSAVVSYDIYTEVAR